MKTLFAIILALALWFAVFRETLLDWCWSCGSYDELPGQCCPCGPQFACGDCPSIYTCNLYYKTVTASGFSADCANFNGSFLCSYAGADANGFPCWISTQPWGQVKVGGGNNSTAESITFTSGASNARYRYPGGTGLCNLTPTTLNLFGSTCTSAPATVTLTGQEIPWNCQCWAHLPMPRTLFVTVTNSTCVTVPNGLYTLTYSNAGLGGGFGSNTYVAPTSGGCYLSFWPGSDSGCGIGSNCPSCGTGDSSWALNVLNTFTCFEGSVSYAVLGCSCLPFSASGHHVCSLGGSFDWSASQ